MTETQGPIPRQRAEPPSSRRLHRRLPRTPLAESLKLTETLLVSGDEISAFHKTGRVTNGRIEGTDNKTGRPWSATDRQRIQPRRSSSPHHLDLDFGYRSLRDGAWGRLIGGGQLSGP